MGGSVESWTEEASSASSSSAVGERPHTAEQRATRVTAPNVPIGGVTTPASLAFGHLTPVSTSTAPAVRTLAAPGNSLGLNVDAHSVRLRLKVEQLTQQLEAAERRNQAMQRQLERGTARELKLQQQHDETARRHAAHVAQLEQTHAETERLATEERESVAEERGATQRARFAPASSSRQTDILEYALHNWSSDVLVAIAADIEDDFDRRDKENAELRRQNKTLEEEKDALQAALDAKTAEMTAANQAALTAAGDAAAKLAESTTEVERGREEISWLRQEVTGLQQANAELNSACEQITRVASRIAGAVNMDVR